MIAIFFAALACAQSQVQVEGRALPPAVGEALAQAREVIQHGRDFLIQSQNPDGSWGGPQHPMIYDRYWSNPETHRSWQIATTGLVCMALMDMPTDREAQSALNQGIDYLTNAPSLKRPSDWDTDNTWGYVYGLAALTKAAQNPRLSTSTRKVAIEMRGKAFLRQLWAYQAPNGGWAYYDDDTKAQRPSWGTSFMTAVAVLGILDAKQLGWKIEEPALKRGIEALQHARLPDGSYTYSIEILPVVDTGVGIDRVRGSLSRIQVCNLALIRAKEQGYAVNIQDEDLRQGLQQLFREHHYLDIARGRPIPHEAFHYNSGYFYFFGHYYAGAILQRLSPADRNRFLVPLVASIAKTQSRDGSMIDFFMNDYGKPYGVAFGMGCLLQATASLR